MCQEDSKIYYENERFIFFNFFVSKCHACIMCTHFCFVYLLIGVEGVVIDMAKNEVTIKGIVEPQTICNTITKKTKRRALVISPLPSAEGEPIPEVVNSQVLITTFYLSYKQLS
jgi:hypothetical protein